MLALQLKARRMQIRLYFYQRENNVIMGEQDNKKYNHF